MCDELGQGGQALFHNLRQILSTCDDKVRKVHGKYLFDFGCKREHSEMQSFVFRKWFRFRFRSWEMAVDGKNLNLSASILTISKSNAGMRIRFGKKTGPEALYPKRKDIFKSLLNEYFS